jgi:hypothetical protein
MMSGTSFIIFSDVELRGWFFAVKGILNSVRNLEASDPAVIDFMEKLADFLEHISRAENVSLQQYDHWKMVCEFRTQQCSEAFDRIPRSALGTVVRKLVAPIAPKIRRFIDSADPSALSGLLIRLLGEQIILQSERHDDLLRKLTFGVQTMKLMRALVTRMTRENKTRALEIVSQAKRSLDDAPKYDIFLDNLAREGADDELSELRVADLAVRTVGSLYEHRGKIVIELLWKLMHLLGWVKPNAPSDAHDRIVEKLLENNVGESLGAFVPDWRHWRNASNHKGMLQRVYNSSGMFILIRDENMQGAETYRRLVSPEEACAEAGKAIDVLHSNGCFPMAFGLLGNELRFDLILDEADMLAFCNEALGALMHISTILSAEESSMTE